MFDPLSISYTYGSKSFKSMVNSGSPEGILAGDAMQAKAIGG